MSDCSPRTLALLRDLIAFDTTSRNSNLDLIHYIRDHLAALGVESTLVFDDTRTKANLYATIGPTDRGGICLSGHTDVVPVDDQDWSSDPFTLTERDGKLYGRGTADMKGFVATALAMAPDFLAAELKTPIHYAFSYDEELGCIGVRGLLERLAGMAVKPRFCIVGEPTSMQVVVGHKGKLSMRCHVHGHACHSSLAPRGVNAVEYASEVVAYLRRMGRRFALEGPFDPDYDVPHTTVHTGVIQGGTARNIVPTDCAFEFEFRHIATHPVAPMLAEVQDFAHKTLEPEMRAVQPGTGFSWAPLSEAPALDTPPDLDDVALVKHLVERNDHGKVAFGTEGALYTSMAGIPAVVCGPGDIDQAHKPDEFVSLDQLARAERFLTRLKAAVVA
ncbi:acetylornithine deacetylase [Azospirillum canadense]|uniref:acetylornithine deacetylase n=1 Tax=Azospirillum canadense TaxID=403962 RepID=UPI00222649BE|nr:acetylornithine deacetylase [Azospirillum canadense]MCW2244271.1 acetylornithine deacetylase [Azospirillum canadense]